jgi:gliding motility-associated-like protein
VCFILLFVNLQSLAQLRVDNTRNAESLIKQVLADKGVVIGRVTASTSNLAIGFFDGTQSNLGLDSGIILSTGRIQNAVGPNDRPNVGTSNNQPGDPLITLLSPGQSNFDAAWIEFEITPESDELNFRFIFASEEYPENNNTSFNDAFGLFISGPGISGNQNLALIPGTNTPVSINTINNATNQQWYVDNTGGASVQFDGFTQVIEASATVTPCQMYTLKFVIADVKDLIFDSGIFIEASSLQSQNKNGVSLVTNESSFSECDSNFFMIERNSDDLSEEIIVSYTLEGRAGKISDYSFDPPSPVRIAPGEARTFVKIKGILDGIPEPSENIIMKITNPVICDTVQNVINLGDYRLLSELEFRFTCNDSSTSIDVKDNDLLDSISWFNLQGDFITGGPRHIVDLNDSSYYVVRCRERCTGNVLIDTVRIITYKLTTNGDTTICYGDTLHLSVSSGLSNARYEWNSSAGGSFSPSPLSRVVSIVPLVTGLIEVRATNDGVCAKTSFRVQVIRLAVTANDASICESGAVQLEATGGTSYKWTPSTFLSNDSIANPICTADTSMRYQVLVKNGNCEETFQVRVRVDSLPLTNTIANISICTREFVRLTTSGALTYEWFPTSGIDSPTIASPMANPSTTTTYYVKGSNGSCFVLDSVTIFVRDSIGTEIALNYDSCQAALTAVQQFANDNSDVIWDMGDGTTYAGKSISHEYQQAGTYFITATSNATAPCATSETISIHVPEVNISARGIPNVFSPNNDGENDVFKIYGGNTNCRIKTFQIFNRWGEQVFEGTEANNFEWDGQYNGKLCDAGVYVFAISGEGFSDTGWIALIR